MLADETDDICTACKGMRPILIARKFLEVDWILFALTTTTEGRQPRDQGGREACPDEGSSPRPPCDSN
jgi:hypothetical protein